MARKAAADRIYLCASEWLCLLKDEPQALVVQTLIDRASKGAWDIVGSELLYIEVLHEGSLDLLRTGVRTWAAMDHRIAMRTRELRQQAIDGGRSVSGKTADLIHIATADVAGAVAFITADEDCRKLATFLGLEAFDRGEFPDDELRLTPERA